MGDVAHWVEGASVVDGRRLAWRRAGAGPGLAHLHDAGGDTLASPALADLTADHEVLVVDLPGYGRCDPPCGLAARSRSSIR